MARLAAALLGLALLAGLFGSGSSVQIDWAGRTWLVRVTRELQGPGPNYYSDSPNNVMVESNGNLRLQVTKTGGKWVCAEISLPNSLGYGTYVWTVTSGAGSLDPRVTLGLFTYASSPEQAHREIDIEFARFGQSPARDPTNAQFALQPVRAIGHVQRWVAPPVSPSTPPVVVSFTWTPGQTFWEARQDGTLLSTKKYAAGDVPTPGPEVVHINLWLTQPTPGVVTGPTNGRTATVYLSDFTFTPHQARE